MADLDVESVLRRLLEDARDLTGAHYAAIGILNERKEELERFVFIGIDEEMRQRIGDLPRGRGILGELIRNPEPLRLESIGAHPRSYGFPPNHPPMTSFLGVPVMIRGEVFGNLYLTDKAAGEPFTTIDEQLVILLSEWAAIAIDNARNYERAERQRGELERAVRGLQTNANLSRELGGESDPARVLELTAKRARALVDARSAAVLFREGDEFVIAEIAGELAPEIRERRLPARSSPAEEVLGAGAGQRLGELAIAWFAAAGIEARDAVLVPLATSGDAAGVLAVFDQHGDAPAYTADDVLVLGSFATAASAAIATSSSLEREMRQLSIASSESERRRWARDLHDETLQELGALKVIGESALRGRQPEMLERALASATEQVTQVIEGIERLITELRPAALDELGAQAAIDALATRVRERTGLAIDADFDLDWESGRVSSRLVPDLEETIYRVVQEALNNVVKHAQATGARIAVTEADSAVTVTVEDDGKGIEADGGDGGRGGFGLLGMRERVSLAGGELEIGPGPSGGTRVRATLPVRRRPEQAAPGATLRTVP